MFRGFGGILKFFVCSILVGWCKFEVGDEIRVISLKFKSALRLKNWGFWICNTTVGELILMNLIWKLKREQLMEMFLSEDIYQRVLNVVEVLNIDDQRLMIIYFFIFPCDCFRVLLNFSELGSL